MQIQVAKQDLMEALTTVAPSLAGSGNDLTTHFVFRASPLGDPTPEKVEVLAFSTRVYSSAPLRARLSDLVEAQAVTIPNSSMKVWAFTIEGKRLRMWLDSISEGAITFDFNGQVTKVSVPSRGSQTFSSLNPALFPFWDNLYSEAISVAKIDPARLKGALNYAKHFVGDQESKSPELCIAEMRDGSLHATNRRVMVWIKIAGLENAKFRIHFKDIPALSSFLDTSKGEIEILEHDRALLLRRPDGAVAGESRSQAMFPKLVPVWDQPTHHWWVLPKQDILDAIKFLVAGAAPDDNRVRFCLSADATSVVLKMSCAAGETASQVVRLIEAESDDKAPPLPPEGFPIDHGVLVSVLAHQQGPNVKIGLNSVVRRDKTSGLIRFLEDRQGDHTLTVIPWLTA